MDFDLPDAKRIRRADLTHSSSPSRSPSPSAEVAQSLHTRLAALYGPISLPTSDPDPQSNPNLSSAQKVQQPQPEEDEVEEQAFEFRLFSTDTGKPSTKITLHDEEESPGGFVSGPRPASFYIVPPLSPLAKAQFHFAALSSSDVIQRAKGRNWGLEVPWRVAVLSSTAPDAGLSKRKLRKQEISGTGKKEGKTKPNKKRRIILRERERERVVREEAKRKERESKEEAEKEKRTRRNREKKVKRKMKEKALKAGGGDPNNGKEEGDGGE